MLVLLIIAASAVVVYGYAPADRFTHATTRGAIGAVRGLFTNGSDPISDLFAGARDGVRRAKRDRGNGKDPWSRIVAGAHAVRDAGVATKQAGGRLGNGIVAGARGAGRGARWTRDHGHAASAWSSRLAARIAERIRNRQARRNATTEEANPEPTPTPEPAPTHVDVDEDLGPTWIDDPKPEHDPGVETWTDSPLNDPYAQLSHLIADSQRRNADKLWLEDTSTWTATAGRRWINEHIDEIQAATSPEDLDILREFMADLRSRLPAEHGPDAAPIAWIDEIETAVAARLAEFGAPYNPVTADSPGLWASVDGGKQRRAEYVLTPDALEKVRGHIADGHTGSFDSHGDRISQQDAEARIEALRAGEAADDRFFQLRDSGYDGWIDQDGQAVDDLDAWIEEHRPTSTNTTTTEGNPTMNAISEFANISDLEAELRDNEQKLLAAAELMDVVLSRFTSLPDRWAAAQWGTQRLDQVMGSVVDMVPAVSASAGSVAAAAELMQGATAAVRVAATVGEAAAAHGAHGDVRAFQPA